MRAPRLAALTSLPALSMGLCLGLLALVCLPESPTTALTALLLALPLLAHGGWTLWRSVRSGGSRVASTGAGLLAASGEGGACPPRVRQARWQLRAGSLAADRTLAL